MSEKREKADIEKAAKSLQTIEKKVLPLTKNMKMGYPEIDDRWKTNTGNRSLRIQPISDNHPKNQS